MITYTITKINKITGKEIKYTTMIEEYVDRVLDGYTEIVPNVYDSVDSMFYFIIDTTVEAI